VLVLGPLAFLQPWLLLALASLPLIWWLLRATPPAPRLLRFPPIFLLFALSTSERTPARTPWWLLLLRIAIALLLILALAQPVLHPREQLVEGRDVVIALDDGWSAAPGWRARETTLELLFDQAARAGAQVWLLRTAPEVAGIRLEAVDPAEASDILAGLAPKPWPSAYAEAAAVLEAQGPPRAQVFWLAAPVVEDEESARGFRAFAEALLRRGETVMFTGPQERPLLLLPPERAPEGLRLALLRAVPGAEEARDLLLLGEGEEVLARAQAVLADGARRAEIRVELPLDLVNRVARVVVAGEESAAAVVLFDERWRRRVVGIVGALEEAESRPLLSEVYYLRRALEPYAEVRAGRLDELLQSPSSLLVLADLGRLPDDQVERLRAWIRAGGVVMRFAGPKLAAGGDGLLPVALRRGDRMLGGALSWSRPLGLAPFPEDGPFAGLAPDPEVKVRRQLLAEPGPELDAATLARLEDGTPIITGRKLGRGWLILVHTTADPSWSSLALSRLFLDLLRRTLELAPGVGGEVQGLLRPRAVLDGFGRLQPPPGELLTVPAERFRNDPPGPLLRPGLWVSAEARGEAPAAALNLQRRVKDLRPAPEPPAPLATRPYLAAGEVPLWPALLFAALLLVLLDLALALWLRGLLPQTWRWAGATALLPLLVAARPLVAASDMVDVDSLARLAAETRLAYVRTGIPEVDAKSEAGLKGLGLVLARRTSVEPAEPVAVEPWRDELALFPLLYWPVPPDHPDLPEGTLARVQAYLEGGGLILFDTGDAARLLPGQNGLGPGQRRLRELFGALDLPPLRPLPEDHVLTRSFYLLQDFPGRFTGQLLWVDEAPPTVNDGVSRVIIGAHDWAGAWAVDEFGAPLYPTVPGGERQREMARRFGVNLVMYALTGNYKTDQVHIPALLERLGQ